MDPQFLGTPFMTNSYQEQRQHSISVLREGWYREGSSWGAHDSAVENPYSF